MALLATLHDHRRAAERQALEAGATLRVDGNPHDALIANISASGCLFVCERKLEVGDTVSVGIAGLGRRDARIVRTLDSRYGVEFVTPLLPSEIETAAAIPDETVIPLFPWPVIDRSFNVAETIASPLATPQTRLMIVVALVVSTWACIFIAFHAVK